jgi:hypothetical protein
MKSIKVSIFIALLIFIPMSVGHARVANINVSLNWNHMQGTPKQVIYTINPNCATQNPPSDEEQIAAIETALGTWNEWGGNIQLHHIGSNNYGNYNQGEGSNDICWTNMDPPDPDAIAMTKRYRIFDDNVGWHLNETDIFFFNRPLPLPPWAYLVWSTIAPPPGNGLDIQSIALHELGHAIGLDDEFLESSSVMYYQLTLGTTRRILDLYDCSGIETIYNFNAITPPEPWIANHQVTFQWTNQSLADPDYLGSVDIALNRNYPNPEAWEVIAQHLPNTGSYQRNLDGNISNTCAFRVISHLHHQIHDLTDQMFAIVGYCITNPDPDVTWYIGQLRDIQWNSAGVTGPVNLYLVPVAGGPITIATGIDDVGHYIWTVNSPVQFTCYRIKIENAQNPEIFAYSPQFWISWNNSLQVISPNGGETWYWPDYEVVTWNFSGWWINAQVNIELHHDGQITPLAVGVCGNLGYGAKVLAVPHINSDNCRIRVISQLNPEIYDDSDGPFKILPYPTPGTPAWYLIWYECMNVPPNPISINPAFRTQDVNPADGFDTWDTPPFSIFDNYVAYCDQTRNGNPNPDPWYHPNATAELERLIPISTTEAKDLKFQFWAKIDLPYWDPGDYLEPFYTPGDGAWHSLGKIYGINPRPSEPPWQLFEYPSLGMMPSFRYKLVFHSNGGNWHYGVNYYWAYKGVWVDEIKLYGKYYIEENDSTAEIIKQTSPANIPTVYSLAQNAPNPFNSTTTIRFGLPEAMDVRLSIYDISGRKVAQLVDTRLPAGYHDISFDDKNIASGLYIYQIQAGEYNATGKMVLLK